MGTINNAFILGNLGANPDVHTTKDGHAYCTLRVATHRRSNPDDRSEIATTWHRVKLWRHNAEFAHRHLKKGDPVAIEGRILNEQWTDGSGNPRSATLMVGTRITLVGGPRGGVKSIAPEPQPEH